MEYRKQLTTYVKRLAHTLYQNGVTRVVISPGSRSTPLAYAFAMMKEVEIYLQVDERSAAFFALGLAKANHTPVALLCTSGTAASNYMPAITEASYARVPLIAITADRPHELREVGAPQAIDQVNMFGHFVKESIDYPLADGMDETDRFIEHQTSRLLNTAMTAPKGPVHLNVPFREPLLIDLEDTSSIETTFIQSMPTETTMQVDASVQLGKRCAEAKRGLIIVGDVNGELDEDLFWAFVKRLNWPVLADPLSNLRSRTSEEKQKYVVETYDALLKHHTFRQQVKPDLVLRFGAQPVSKPLLQFLEEVRPVTITVDDSPFYRDPLGITTYHVQGRPETVTREQWIGDAEEYRKTWIEANDEAKRHIQSYTPLAGDEGQYVLALLEAIENHSDLISGSSMPIRDLDTFWLQTEKDIRLYANRGTNGIDGVTSTAFGIQKARKRPATLLIGDLSFLHDTNALLLSRYEEVALKIVVLNNDGGGIFSYLPQASVEAHYERLFGTPTGLQFEDLAKMYHLDYDRVETVEQFKRAYTKKSSSSIQLIEVITSRRDNVISHRKLWDTIGEAIER